MSAPSWAQVWGLSKIPVLAQARHVDAVPCLDHPRPPPVIRVGGDARSENIARGRLT